MRISDWSSDVCSSDLAKENASLESIQHKFGTDEDWTGGLLREAGGNFDGISEHWYDRAQQLPDAPPAAELPELARAPPNQVRVQAEEWRIPPQDLPNTKANGLLLAIKESAYTSAPPTHKHTPTYFMEPPASLATTT